MSAKSSLTSLKHCQSFLNDDMEAQRRKMPLNYFKSRISNKHNLQECGLRLINHLMKDFNEDQTGLRRIVNEILHSIFFLGFVHKNSLTPGDFFLSANIAETVRQEFPKPFEKYQSHLPRRTPFSGLLHIMELKYDSKEEIIEGLCSLMSELEFPEPWKKPGSKYQNYYTLESAVICVCFKGSLSSNTYFGASVGCKEAKCIMIYSSCLNTWHEYVSHAVMSFNVHRTEGDSLTFPESVQCQALYRDWKTNTYEEKSPCWKCQRIFNLPGSSVIEQERYPYGNCAETECLSKLLFNDQSVRERTVINYRNSRSNCRQLKESTRNQLREELARIPALKDAMMNNEDLPLFNP